MARKSRDFQELMIQKRTSQNRHKNLEAHRQKMQEVIGEMDLNMSLEVNDDGGGIKMSEVLQQFIAPYLDNPSVNTLKKRKALFSLAAIAWNTASMPESDQKSILDTFLETRLLSHDRETQDDARQIIDELIARKLKYFSEIKRFIMDFQIKETRNEYHISVASAPLKTSE